VQVQQEKTFKISPKDFDTRGNMIMDGYEGIRGNDFDGDIVNRYSFQIYIII
jgi:hypothetical protein